jgi:transposase
MALYSAIDLHSNNSYLAIVDDDFQTVFNRRLPNDLEVILAALRPYRSELTGVAVESTYNWYWLVDGLMDNDYRTHLVNTSAVVQYKGLKYSDDDHEARWLARLLKLGILPEGYIYPREDRGIRDLLRRRSVLVRKRTDLLLSSKTVYARQTGQRVSANELKKWKAQEVATQVEDECLALSIGSCVAVIETLTEQIRRIEKYVLKRARLREPFGLLKGVGGIGDTLALTIMYEIGEIGRFPAVGNFASYCRCVDSTRWSNGKKKGKGNVKNGNPYLSWAFTEAAHGALRFEPLAKRWYDRKVAKTMQVIAIRAVATKLARACYHVLRDGVPFEAARAFS